MMMQVTENILLLPGGRKLGYGLYGNPGGAPVLDFHGIPGSRSEAQLLQRYLQREDLLIIGVDRPGYGRSTPVPHLKIPNFAADVAYLCDHLEIQTFSALGFSGGGPFALAAAALLKERITSLVLVSSVGPSDTGSKDMHDSNRKKFNMAQQLPWLAHFLLKTAFSGLKKNPQRLERQLNKVWAQMPLPDRDVLTRDPSFARAMLEITSDAISQSVEGWVNEELLMAAPWGFSLATITCPQIHLHHGMQDRNVPLAMAENLAARLPACQTHFHPQDGHISCLYNHSQEIFSNLLA